MIVRSEAEKVLIITQYHHLIDFVDLGDLRSRIACANTGFQFFWLLMQYHPTQLGVFVTFFCSKKFDKIVDVLLYYV